MVYSVDLVLELLHDGELLELLHHSFDHGDALVVLEFGKANSSLLLRTFLEKLHETCLDVVDVAGLVEDSELDVFYYS